LGGQGIGGGARLEDPEIYMTTTTWEARASVVVKAFASSRCFILQSSPLAFGSTAVGAPIRERGRGEEVE
jgi:hypothetical protein